ncbi:MAG: hypothetical protein J0H68_01855 [Sphingobacteriia bacterium]|nr:hypothetical protein [Sphingobacteriia bacterium]
MLSKNEAILITNKEDIEKIKTKEIKGSIRISESFFRNNTLNDLVLALKDNNEISGVIIVDYYQRPQNIPYEEHAQNFVNFLEFLASEENKSLVNLTFNNCFFDIKYSEQHDEQLADHCEQLATLINSNKIKSLNLDNNLGITEVGAEVIAKALESNTSLEVLKLAGGMNSDLYNNGGIALILNALANNKTLKELYIPLNFNIHPLAHSYRSRTTGIVPALANFLETNNVIEVLSLQDASNTNPIDSEVSQIYSALAKNESLKMLQLKGKHWPNIILENIFLKLGGDVAPNLKYIDLPDIVIKDQNIEIFKSFVTANKTRKFKKNDIVYDNRIIISYSDSNIEEFPIVTLVQNEVEKQRSSILTSSLKDLLNFGYTFLAPERRANKENIKKSSVFYKFTAPIFKFILSIAPNFLTSLIPNRIKEYFLPMEIEKSTAENQAIENKYHIAYQMHSELPAKLIDEILDHTITMHGKSIREREEKFKELKKENTSKQEENIMYR